MSTPRLTDRLETFGITDPACPFVEGNTFSGGCTDEDGRTWWGELSWDPDWGGSTAGFGHDREDGCWELRAGSVYIEASGGGTNRTFSVAEWTLCGGDVDAVWAVEGRSSHGYDDGLDEFLWSWRGTFAASALGRAAVSDAGDLQVACASEPDRGVLTVESGAHTLAYAFDGATECDGLVPVALDGVEAAAVAY